MSDSLRDDDDESSQLSLAAKVVNEMFDRHDVPSNKRTRAVERILNISYPAANRRVRGDAAWPLEDLAKVAEDYGESLSSLFSRESDQEHLDATLLIGSFQITARICLSENDEPAIRELVAIFENERWIVRPSTEGVTGKRIRSLILDQSAHVPPKVAIVDDDFESALSLSDYLNEVGFDASAFASFDEFDKSRSLSAYQACLLDWWVGQSNASRTVQSVFMENPECAIGIVTGQMGINGSTSDEIASVITRFRIAPPFEKPTRGPIIAAWLRCAISEKADRKRDEPSYKI